MARQPWAVDLTVLHSCTGWDEGVCTCTAMEKGCRQDQAAGRFIGSWCSHLKVGAHPFPTRLWELQMNLREQTSESNH